MLDDFTIIKAGSTDLNECTIFPLGDVHLGSKECNLDLLYEWRSQVEQDPNARAVIVGDMLNMAIKSSVSNIYEDIMMPKEQKEFCYEFLLPIKDKIIGVVSGNHEYRNVKEVGTNPLYDVCCRLGIEDVYRENVCFIKLTVGRIKNKNPNVITIVLTHGKSRKKDLDWANSVDGVDLFIQGHTHQPELKPMTKIKFDAPHETVKCVEYNIVTVASFQNYGGYAIRNKYLPHQHDSFQRIVVSNDSKRIGYYYY